MNFGITKTIPQSDGIEAVNNLYDGPAGEFEFHMAGKPSRLKVGHFVYTIFNDQLVGRLEITRLVGGATNPKSGKPRTLIYVRTPGERLPVRPHVKDIVEPVTMKGRIGLSLKVS